MPKPFRPADHARPLNRRFNPLVALLVAFAMLPATLAAAQDSAADPPAANDAAETEAAQPAEAPELPDLPLVTNVAEPEGEPTLKDRFDGTLETITNGVATALFFDMAFGALQSTVTDDAGNVVYEDEPVKKEADATFQALLTTKGGKPIRDANGQWRVVTVDKGSSYQPVSADGTPQRQLVDPKAPKTKGPEVPFLVIFLATGAIFFTVWHGFINLRGFKHAIDIVRGRFSKNDDEGDIPPFRALTSALSATVGLGNIAGVAIAVKTGGPGAIFWMMFLGLFGMTAKFHESSLAQMFRIKNEDGSVSGGPMYVLDQGFKQIGGGVGALGRVLAIVFAVFCLAAALGGGNMFQANQAFEGFYSQFVQTESLAEQQRDELPGDILRPLLSEAQLDAAAKGDLAGMEPEAVRVALPEDRVRAILLPSQIELVLDPEQVAKDAEASTALKGNVSIGFGLVFATIVGIVVIGGITRIGAATCRIVPAMCLIYVAGCLIVIFSNLGQIPSHVGLIFSDAFAPESAFGGFVGVLIIGFTRAAFSSEAGLGSSAIAHSAAQQKEPIREGFVASLEPFIDTIVICFMTAMVVLITDAYVAPELAEQDNGAAITLFAFEQTRLGNWFPYVLSVSIILFAFSTMISWCYYGERAWGYLVGLKSVIIFRLLFVVCVFVGTVASLGPVLSFSDVMLLSMALPNIIGGVVLAKLVKRELGKYWGRYKSGDFDRPEPTPDTTGQDI